MALFMLKDMHQYKIKDIEPKYLRDTKKSQYAKNSGGSSSK